eukprot:TRINITY_DN25391_c0_g1_i1.p1 TRINITY_DN25391_c0_g1~~TRINITY_DN25391_c0_g1_i1.p1  ORF type:complete len:161 (+),score=47.75 TRINITY_DN25391_c0_g1_i1:50-484(+)
MEHVIMNLRNRGTATFFFRRKVKKDKTMMTAEERELRKEHKQHIKAIRQEGSRLRGVWEESVHQQHMIRATSPKSPRWRDAPQTEAFSRWQLERREEGFAKPFTAPHRPSLLSAKVYQEQRPPSYNPYMPAQSWISQQLERPIY